MTPHAKFLNKFLPNAIPEYLCSKNCKERAIANFAAEFFTVMFEERAIRRSPGMERLIPRISPTEEIETPVGIDYGTAYRVFKKVNDK